MAVDRRPQSPTWKSSGHGPVATDFYFLALASSGKRLPSGLPPPVADYICPIRYPSWSAVRAAPAKWVAKFPGVTAISICSSPETGATLFLGSSQPVTRLSWGTRAWSLLPTGALLWAVFVPVLPVGWQRLLRVALQSPIPPSLLSPHRCQTCNTV